MQLYIRETPSTTKISNAEEMFLEMRDIGKADQECIYLITLTVKNDIIGKHCVSLGGIDNTSLEPVIVFRRVIQDGAKTFILCHNHPSGDCTPSADDIRVTNRLKQCCDLLDVIMLDHIIIAGDKWISLKEQGLM